MGTTSHHHSSLQGKVPQVKHQNIHLVPMVRGQKMRNHNKTLSKDTGLMLLGFSIPSSIIMNKWHSKITYTLHLLTMSRIGLTSVSGTKTPLIDHHSRRARSSQQHFKWHLRVPVDPERILSWGRTPVIKASFLLLHFNLFPFYCRYKFRKPNKYLLFNLFKFKFV